MRKSVKYSIEASVISLLVLAGAFILVMRALWRALDIDSDWEAL